MSEYTIRYRTDTPIELIGPVNVATGAAIDSGATCTCRAYDLAAQSRTELAWFESSAAVSASATIPIVDYGWLGSELANWAGGTGAVFEYLDVNGVLKQATVSSVVASPPAIVATTPVSLPAGTRLQLVLVPIGYTHIPVGAVVDFAIADVIELLTADGAIVDGGSILDIRPPPSVAPPEYPTLLRGSTVGATVQYGGLVVRKRIGTPITMTLYASPTGTNTPGADDWGYRGTIPDTIGFRAGQRVQIEVEFDAGAALKLLERREAVVVL